MFRREFLKGMAALLIAMNIPVLVKPEVETMTITFRVKIADAETWKETTEQYGNDDFEKFAEDFAKNMKQGAVRINTPVKLFEQGGNWTITGWERNWIE